MKHFIQFAFALLIVVAGTTGKSFAQTRHYIDSLKIIPQNLDSSVSIKVVCYVALPYSNCNLDSSSIIKDGFKVTINAYYIMGLGAMECNSTDTITIGKLNKGDYKLIYNVNVLNIVVSDSLNFTVQQANGAYFPFPNSNASWTVLDIGFGAPPPGTFTKFKIGNDTIIKTNLYKQIIAADYNDYKSYGTYYFAAVREKNKKWFSVPPRDSVEYLFYDFSVNVGDTIHSHYYFGISPQPDSITLIVKSIDSILIGNTYRKRIYLNSQGDYWIEGIGSLKGLFYPGDNGFDSDHKLLCFKENDIITYYYPNYQNSCNDTLLGYEELFHNKTINIYPVEHSIIIETNTSEPLNIIFYDLFGRKLMEKFITDKHSELLFNYPTGLYFYQLFSISGVPQQQGKILLKRN